MAFEAAERFFAGFSFGLFAGEVGGGVGVPVGFVDGEAVKGAVELAVAAAVEAVAVGVARGGGDRCGPAGAGELCVGAEAVGAGDLADQLRGGQRPAAALLRAAAARSSRRARRALARVRGSRLVLAVIWRTSSRATRTRVVCSARARRREAFPSHLAVSSAPGGISSSGQRSCRCQRSRC